VSVGRFARSTQVKEAVQICKSGPLPALWHRQNNLDNSYAHSLILIPSGKGLEAASGCPWLQKSVTISSKSDIQGQALLVNITKHNI